MRSFLAGVGCILLAAVVSAQRLSVVDLLSDTVSFFGVDFVDPESQHAEGYDVRHHPSGRFAVVSRPAAGEINFFDLRESRVRPSEPAIHHAAWTLDFTPDGSCLVATRPDGVMSFDVAAREVVSDVSTGYTTSAIAVAPPNVVLLGDTRNHRIAVLTVDLDTCVLADSKNAAPVGGATTSDPTHLAVSPDGRLVAVVNRSSGIDLFQIEGTSLKPAGIVSYPAGALALSAAFTPDGSRLYVHQGTFIRALKVEAPAVVTDTETRIPIEGTGPVGLPGPRQVVTDGKFVYFTVRGGVWAASVETGQVVAKRLTGNNPAALALTGVLKPSPDR